MIWVKNARYCDGGVVDLTDLASSRSIWGIGRSHGGVSEKTGGKTLVVNGAGHGSTEAVSDGRRVGAVG